MSGAPRWLNGPLEIVEVGFRAVCIFMKAVCRTCRARLGVLHAGCRFSAMMSPISRYAMDFAIPEFLCWSRMVEAHLNGMKGVAGLHWRSTCQKTSFMNLRLCRPL